MNDSGFGIVSRMSGMNEPGNLEDFFGHVVADGCGGIRSGGVSECLDADELIFR